MLIEQLSFLSEIAFVQKLFLSMLFEKYVFCVAFIITDKERSLSQGVYEEHSVRVTAMDYPAHWGSPHHLEL